MLHAVADLVALGRPKRPKAPLVSATATAETAGQLHVIHQTVLRLGGLRISEFYGLVVGDFFCDPDGGGFQLASAQGGRIFRQRTDADEVAVTSRKEADKTDSAYRLLVPARSHVTGYADAGHVSVTSRRRQRRVPGPDVESIEG